jgi:Uncharacterized protein conserved in bacteria (DUF2066).
VCLVLLAVIVAWAVPVAAQENPYEVTGVHVDVTAEDAAAARRQALADGARLALEQMVERYVPEERRGRFAKMPQQQIEDMISDFSIRSEKTSAVRYIATLDYRFKPSRVSRLLRSAGAVLPTSSDPSGTPEALPPPKPIIVVPIFEAGPGQAPGGGADPWRDAWQSLAERSGGRYVLASGDTAAIAADEERLAALVRRTGGDSALVAIASIRAVPDGAPHTVDVRFSRQGRSRQASGAQAYAPTEGEEPQAFYRRVAAAIQAEANAAWRSAASVPKGERSVLQASVPVSDLPEWLKLQKQIRGVDGVRSLEVVMMSRREMLVRLAYSGSYGDLTRHLEDADFVLDDDDDDHRVLTRDTSPIEPAETGVEPATP